MNSDWSFQLCSQMPDTMPCRESACSIACGNTSFGFREKHLQERERNGIYCLLRCYYSTYDCTTAANDYCVCIDSDNVITGGKLLKPLFDAYIREHPTHAPIPPPDPPTPTPPTPAPITTAAPTTPHVPTAVPDTNS